MSVTLSVENVPEELAAKLQERARRFRRSLQGEILMILEKAAVEPESKERPAPRETKESKETSEGSEESEHRRHCDHGMVYTRSGCVAAHRRSHDADGEMSNLRQYYRRLYPGSVMPPF